MLFSFLEELLLYGENLGKSVDTHTKDDTAKFWRSLLSKTYDVIGSVYELLPFESFVGIVSGLMEKESALTRRKSLELLCSKLSALSKVDESQV